MKHLVLFLFLWVAALQFTEAQSASPYFAEYPTLSPDGQTLVFSYDGDLWKAALQGGMATRITAMQDVETRPRISPDGKWIAFSGRQYGNDDVYLMPLAGGEIRRLTFHQSDDMVESWSWDNRYIYFTSDRYNQMSTYKISIEGGTPTQVFSDNYFDFTHNAVEDPVSGALFFDDTWESAFFANRIGYKGPFNPDIQSYDPRTKTYKRYTDWIGKDMWPTIDRKGNLYFVSDQANGQYNLYSVANGKKTQLTSFSTSIWHPFIDAAGDKIVFEKDYRLWEYDVASGKSMVIPLEIYRNNTLPESQDYNVAGHITAYDLSGDGKKLALVSRGILFVCDAKGKFVRELSTLPQERVLEVHWLKDNRTLIYGQTWKGFENWFTQDAAGEEKTTQITWDSSNNRMMDLDSGKTRAVYLYGRDEVRLLNLRTMSVSTLAKDEIWGYGNNQPHFSPDGSYVMYTAKRNFEDDIFLCRLSDRQSFDITNTGVGETDPFWSPDGKYIYFISDRTAPSYPYGMRNPKLYRMPLIRTQEPFRSDKYDSLFATEGKAKADSLGNSHKPGAIQINYQGLMDRLEQLGPSFGQQTDVYVTQQDNKTLVLFISNHDEGKTAIWKLTLEPFEEPKTEKITGAETYGLDIRRAKDNYYALVQGDVRKLNLENNTLDKVDISYHFTKDLEEEFRQMFFETWANLEENYYNPAFNGVNWMEIRDRFAGYLPNLLSRTDLRKLLNDMLGELNSSHYGFFSSGREEGSYYQTRTAATGIMFDNNHPYRVDRVIKNSCADFPGITIQPGDELVEVNGMKVDTLENREYYFAGPEIPDEMELRFRRGADQFNIKLHPQSFVSMRSLLYDEWVENNRHRVSAESHNEVAYVYMKDMSGASLQKFEQDMVSDSVNGRKALILDLRYNTGGNVHDEVLQFLSQRPYLQWKYRDGHMSPQPDFAPAGKPIILLVNQQTLSDGEMTAAGFKQLKLGTILGSDTYHWIIFTSGKELVDGSYYRLPSWGCYTLDGSNLEKNGVKPDIYVNNSFEDRMEGRDPQLDRAVDTLMKQLK